MKKLTDEQISMVMSQHAVGRLVHREWYSSISQCGCVAGVVFGCGEGGPENTTEAFGISVALENAAPGGWIGMTYPAGTDAMLRLLEKAGLA